MNTGDKTERVVVPAMDQLLGTKFMVLDDGFVRVIDYMGSDSAVVQAARVSYGTGEKSARDDRRLIRYLMRHRHTSPFEMCEIKLHVRVPMDTWRQWIRHRTASVNEYSTRYSVAIDAMAVTKSDQWRSQASLNKQGSSGALEVSKGIELSNAELLLQQHCRDVYKERIELGVAREQARKDLPLSTYTEAYWKIDLHNLLHFLRLRLDEYAQIEIRQYAQVIGYMIVQVWCPLVWEAFIDYIQEGVSLSRIDIEIINFIREGETERLLEKCFDFGLLKQEGEVVALTAEGVEVAERIRRVGAVLPWSVKPLSS